MMMKTVFSFLFLFAMVGVTAQPSDDPVLLKIDDKVITKGEFEAIYKKNNRDSVITKEDLDEYIELFVNFKLKVMEAEALGRDTSAQFQRELAGYRTQLAGPYLVDKSITDSLVMEAYQRLQTEVRASHILIKLPADPTPADTLAAYKKIMEVREKALKDPSQFSRLAKTYSEDPSAKTNDGDLGYFTSLQMVYPFESAVYLTPVGEIEGPVRTRFGYHLVKVVDKREARGQLRVAHIMVRTEADDPDEVVANNEKRIREVYQRLQDGDDFADLARKFSDDRSSAAKGGELPAFGAGKMVAEFEDEAFALKNPGDYSKPFTSPYGWHIVKLIERIPLRSYEEMERELKGRIGRDSRSDIPKNSFIAARKKEYNFSDDPKALKIFQKEVDTAYFSGRWEPSTKLRKANKTLFTLDGQKYTQADFTSFLEKRMRPGRQVSDLSNFIADSYAEFINATVMEYEDSRLEAKHPEFRALINEYRDGILLFDLTDEKVWTRAVKDSAGLAEFYEANKDSFMWDERAGYDIYTFEDMKAARKAVKMLKKGKNQDDIREAFNQVNALQVKVESGLKQREDVPVLAQVVWEVGVSDPVEIDGQIKVVQIKEIREPQHKDFSEARGIITAAYQTHLEKEWIAALRANHDIKIERDVLYDIQ